MRVIRLTKVSSDKGSWRGRPTAEQTETRRRFVKKLMLEEGITNREEILRRLKAEMGVVVTRQVIYNDIKQISKLSDKEIGKFELDIMAIYRRQIIELEGMISLERDSIRKAQLIKTLSQLMKDRHSVANAIAVRGKRFDRSKTEKNEEVNIVFGGYAKNKEKESSDVEVDDLDE